MNKRLKYLLVWAAFVVITASGVAVGRWTVKSVSAESDTYQELKLFTEVISLVKSSYVEDVKIKDLIYGAIKGMVSSLDPHSAFMTPDMYKEMKVDTKGEFGGVGIQIGKKGGLLTVIAPIEDTPAYLAGIKAGDIIMKVNNESTDKMTLMDAVNKMRGPRGTKVILSILRKGWTEPKDFPISREIIKVKSVKQKVLEGNIGYIKISQFQEKTVQDLVKAINVLKEKKITSVIIDLRNDPGGLLQSAVGVAEQFLPSHKLVVYIKDRSGDKKDFYTESEGKLDTLPMVVLVNEGSASASEIVAGALKDWNRAVILGVTTFGKGSVQSVLGLSDGSGLRLTTARYYTPNGISIQNTGITPDIIVKIKSENGKEHKVLREKDLTGHLENEQVEGKEGEEMDSTPLELEEKDDTQLQRAIDILKTGDMLKKSNKTS
ncbi:S41 family peptidase [Candidatus Magnetomonas plexicatena]|uniref:S41 family peptidase n=1 Tax=Candidatus Magnetomonas plexicatena TaxID=2552947 RepID=UPI001C77C04F|nr:S41 family peptidase [Nitrospirales bacterium LBB_01]